MNRNGDEMKPKKIQLIKPLISTMLAISMISCSGHNFDSTEKIKNSIQYQGGEFHNKKKFC
jgi:hypothetical protein